MLAPAAKFERRDKGSRRILFVQATDPANYPPLIHASSLIAEAGWEATFLSAPIEGNRLEPPRHHMRTLRSVAEAEPGDVDEQLTGWLEHPDSRRGDSAVLQRRQHADRLRRH